MSGVYLRNPHKVFVGCLEGVSMSLEGVSSVFGGCLEGLWKAVSKYLQCVY